MYGAAARRDLVYLLSRQEPPSLSAAEESQSSEYAVPMVGPQRVFQLLRPHKQTRSIYEMEGREAATIQIRYFCGNV